MIVLFYFVFDLHNSRVFLKDNKEIAQRNFAFPSLARHGPLINRLLKSASPQLIN